MTIATASGSAVDKVTPSSGATAPDPTEANVALIWRTAFPYPASSFYMTATAKRLVERFQESTLKAA